MWVGDWAMKMENGACFLVEDAQQEKARADRFEISPTGVLFGSRVSWATGQAGEIEQAVITEQGSTLRPSFNRPKPVDSRGTTVFACAIGGAGVVARWVHSDAVVRSSAGRLCHERPSRTHEIPELG